MALDFAVAQAVFRARQMERAVNDPGPWEIGYGSTTVPACRWVLEDRVVFVGYLPDVCYVITPEPVLTLLCRGEVVGTRPVEHPGDGGQMVRWELALSQPVLT